VSPGSPSRFEGLRTGQVDGRNPGPGDRGGGAVALTTIAYKDGIIAYDSRMCSGDRILDDDCNKKKIIGKQVFFYAGCWGEETELNQAIDDPDFKIRSHGEAIIIEDGRIYTAGMNDEENSRWKQPLEPDKVYAIGSGAGYALTAMDMGASAKEAVKMAIKRDSNSGGRVRAFKIK